METVSQKYKELIAWFEECSMKLEILEHQINGDKLYSVVISGRTVNNFIDRTELSKVMKSLEEMKEHGYRMMIR